MGPPHSGLSKSDKKRVTSSTQNFSVDLPNLGKTNDTPVCNKNEKCLLPDPNVMIVDVLNVTWEALDAYLCLLSNRSHSKVSSQYENLCLPNDSTDMNWFWDLTDLFTRPPLILPLWKNLLKQPFSQRFYQNLPYLNIQVWHLDVRLNYLQN